MWEQIGTINIKTTISLSFLSLALQCIERFLVVVLVSTCGVVVGRVLPGKNGARWGGGRAVGRRWAVEKPVNPIDGLRVECVGTNRHDTR